MMRDDDDDDDDNTKTLKHKHKGICACEREKYLKICSSDLQNLNLISNIDIWVSKILSHKSSY